MASSSIETLPPLPPSEASLRERSANASANNTMAPLPASASYHDVEALTIPAPDTSPTPVAARMVRYKFPEEPIIDFSLKPNTTTTPDKAADNTSQEPLLSPSKKTGCLDPTRSLFCLSFDNPFRRLFINVLESKAFFVVMLIVIIVNAILLAVPQPRYTQPDWLTLALSICEIVFTSIFALEMLTKIIALGLVLHPGAYLRSLWNIFDGAITILAIVSLAANLQNISALRAVRILRGLRAISHVRQLRALVETLLSALRPVTASLLVIVWLLVIFGVASIHLCDRGAMSSRCFDKINGTLVLSDFRKNSGCTGLGYYSCAVNQTCMTNTSVYDRSPLTYDNFGHAMLIMLKLVGVDNWNNEMTRSAGSCGTVMVFGNVLVVLFGGMLLMNVFLAILMTEYTKAMNKQEAEFEEEARMLEAAQLSDTGMSDPQKHVELLREQTMSDLRLDVTDRDTGGDEIELTEVRQFHTPKSEKLGNSVRSPSNMITTPTSFLSPNATKYEVRSTSLAPAPSDANLLNASSRVRFASEATPKFNRAATLRKTQSSLLFRSVSNFDDHIDEVESVSSASSSSSDNDELQPMLTIREFDERNVPAKSALKRNASTFRTQHTGSMFALAVGESKRNLKKITSIRRRRSSIGALGNSSLLVPNDSVALLSTTSGASDGGGGQDLANNNSLVVQPSAGFMAEMALNENDLLQETENDLNNNDDNEGEEAEKVSDCVASLRRFTDRYANFMLLITALNVVVLAMDHYGIDDSTANVLNMISLGCTVLFFFELFFKCIAYGLKTTFTEPFNVFDLLLLIASIIEYVLLTSTKITALRAIRVLRLLRAFRVLRISRKLSGLRVLLAALMPSFVPACFVLLLLCIIVFVYSVLGMQLFSSIDFGTEWRLHYDTIWDAAIASFIVVTGDNWFDITMTAYYGTGNNYFVFFYFTSLFFIGDHIIYNLFGAVVIDHLERAALLEWDEEEMEDALAITTEQLYPPRLILPQVGEDDGTNEPEVLTKKGVADALAVTLGFYSGPPRTVQKPIIQGHALGCCGPANCFRVFVATFALSTVFAVLSALVLLTNLMYIAFASPVDSSPFDSTADLANKCFVAFYGFEIILQVIARGAFLPRHNVRRYGDGAAFGGLSEREDVALVAFFQEPGSFIQFFLFAVGVGGVLYTPLRWVDGLRAVRLGFAVPALRRVMTSLIATLPNIAYALMLSLVFWTIFAIFGVELFMGTFYHCTDASITYEWNCTGPMPALKGINSTSALTVANLTSRVWVDADTNFNNYYQALFSLFVVAVGEQWEQVMFLAMDATQPNYGPQQDNQPWMSLFFVTFYFCGRFLTFHIVVGVIITFFLRGKRRNDGMMLLSADERAFVMTMRILDASLFSHDPKPPKSCVRLGVFHFLTATFEDCRNRCCRTEGERRKLKHRGHGKHIIVMDMPIYEIFAALVTLCYVVSLAMTGLDVVDESTLELCYYGMICFLVTEALLKIVAFSFIDYFLITECLQDVFVLVVIGVSFVMPSIADAGKLVILLRTVRFSTFFMDSEHAQKLYALVIHSFPTFVNVMAILVIMFFTFGAIGVQLYATVPLNDPLDDLTNFRTIWNSAFALFQVMTSEGWISIARAIVLADCQACDSTTVYPFFVFFVSLSYIVFSQLLAVVVVEHFEELDDCADRRIIASFDDVKTQWRLIGKATSSPLTAERLLRLVKVVPRRLTRLPVGATTRDLFKLIVDMKLPLSADLHIHYRPFVHALAMHAFGLESTRIHNYATRLHEEVFDPRCFTAGHLLAARIIATRWKEYVAAKRRAAQQQL